jgi:hypothetical protein
LEQRLCARKGIYKFRRKEQLQSRVTNEKGVTMADLPVIVVDAVNLIVHVNRKRDSVQTLVADAAPGKREERSV